jgi:molybdopterin converting factor subunit 1
MMKVKVLFFATIRDIVGEKEIEITLPEGSQVRDLKTALIERYPQAEQAMPTMLTSVNHVFSDGKTELSDGAEVAFFPHVSGG